MIPLSHLPLTPTAIGRALLGPGAHRGSAYRAGARLLSGEQDPSWSRVVRLAVGLGLRIVIEPDGEVQVIDARCPVCVAFYGAGFVGCMCDAGSDAPLPICGKVWPPGSGRNAGLACLREPLHEGYCSPMHPAVFDAAEVNAHAAPGAVHVQASAESADRTTATSYAQVAESATKPRKWARE